jgi:hypothetical protein
LSDQPSSTKPARAAWADTLAADIGLQLDQLVERGDVPGIDELEAALCRRCRLPAGTLRAYAACAQEARERFRQELPRQLRATAEGAHCQVDVKLPYVWIGCVQFRQVAEAQWDVSILDAEILERLSTARAADLVQCAERYIRKIEEGTKRAKGFRETLERTCRALQRIGVSPAPICLVMVLCGGGKRVERALKCGTERGEWDGLARADYAFLLRAVTGSPASAPTAFDLRKATQLETRSGQNHIFLPSDGDPRRLQMTPTPYCSISLRSTR